MAEAVTFTSLKNKLLQHTYLPVYLLHGEEGYYLDELVKIFENILPEVDRDFNQYIFYAPQIEPTSVVEACCGFPMMADHQVVILKEAQNVPSEYLKKLSAYAANPNPSTILVIVARGAAVKCAEITKAISASKGVIFEAKKLRDQALGLAISDFVAEKGLHIEPKALAMLQEFVGSDLSRIYNEVDKLTVVLGPGAMITPEAIERNIGISKEYNNFELVAALSRRDAQRAYRIVDYFSRNYRQNPTPVTAIVLFNYFTNLLLAAYCPDKTDAGLMKQLGFRWPFQLNDIKRGMQSYNAWQMIGAIDAIRQFDAQSKGIGSRQNQYDLLHQLIFTILNSSGRISFT